MTDEWIGRLSIKWESDANLETIIRGLQLDNEDIIPFKEFTLDNSPKYEFFSIKNKFSLVWKFLNSAKSLIFKGFYEEDTYIKGFDYKKFNTPVSVFFDHISDEFGVLSSFMSPSITIKGSYFKCFNLTLDDQQALT